MSLKLDIIEAVMRTNPGLLTSAERAKVADSIDPRLQDRYRSSPRPAAASKTPLTARQSRLRDMLAHQLSGGTIDGPATPVGTPADLLEGLSPEARAELEVIDILLQTAVRNGADIGAQELQLLRDELSPEANSRLNAVHRYYGTVAENRRPFMPKIEPEDLMRADGRDMAAARTAAAAMDTIEAVGALHQRMRDQEPEHERKSREEREKPNSERHDLRESVENAHMAHELFGSEATDVPDASEAFRQQAPSVRSSLVAVDAYLSDRDAE